MLTIVAVTPVHAQTPDERVDDLLARQPSPGVEALLLAHATDARVVQRWIGLLTDTNPDLRLAAARALGISNARTSAAELLRALESEQVPAVVYELASALAVVANDIDVARIYAHLPRIDGSLGADIVERLAAARPALVATHIRTDAALRANADAVLAAYVRLARTQPTLTGTIEAAPESATEATVLEGMLQGAASVVRVLPVAVVEAGLRHDLKLRAHTLAYVAAVHGTPKAARTTFPEIRLPAPEAGTSGDEVWMRALEQRWLSGTDTTRLAPMITALPASTRLPRVDLRVLGVLSADERKAYAKRFSLPDGLAKQLREMKLDEPAPRTPDTPPGPSMLLLSRIPASMLADVVRVTGCTPGAGDEQFAAMRFRADGRPAAVALVREPWSPGCERAARAVVAMAYGAPPFAVMDETHALVRLDQEFVSCLAARRADHVEAPDDGGPYGNIAPPKKTRHVNPTYPGDALNARVQGVVQVEAHIDPSGCVGDARVIKHVHPTLDAAALRTVTRWVYTPTLLRGVAVPVVMTTTVNFSLQ